MSGSPAVEYVASVTAAKARKRPEAIFVYAENLEAKGGPSTVRAESNTFGIPVRRAPGKKAVDCFADRPDEVEAVVASLRELYRLGKGKVIVLPSTGLASAEDALAVNSPELYEKMTGILKNHFGASFL